MARNVQEILKPKRVIQIQVHYQERVRKGPLERRPSTTLRYLGVTDKVVLHAIREALERIESAIPA